MASVDDLKRAVGRAAVDRYVVDGMRLGLGTGSTAIWAVRRTAERFAEGEPAAPARGHHEPAVGSRGPVAGAAGRDVERRGHGGGPRPDDRRCRRGGRAGPADQGRRRRAADGEGDRVRVDARSSSSSTGGSSATGSARCSPCRSRWCRARSRPCAGRSQALGAEVELRMAVRKAGPVVTDLGNLLLDARFTVPFDPVAPWRRRWTRSRACWAAGCSPAGGPRCSRRARMASRR